MKKLKNQKGFSLVEMLVCVVIVLLLAGICTTGSNLALDSYNKSLFESNSQMLQSTLDMYLGDILRHSTLEVETTPLLNGNKEVKSVTNTSYGMYEGWIDSLCDGTEKGQIYIHKKGDDITGVKLLSEKVYSNTLKISGFTLEYNETENYIKGGYKIESTVISGLEKECSFAYRILTTD